MGIKLENILTISAEAYMASVGKKMSDYNMQGVHIVSTSRMGDYEAGMGELLRRAPAKAEALVGLISMYSGEKGEITYHATALIPK
ncbi:MAG: hypothetical protein WC852_05970 [Candidatus Nanoarchaeia archaeon]|jgi:hypothetical protein